MAEEKVMTLGVGKKCPHCGSSQFSISVPDIRPTDWPSNTLGTADCACGVEAFVVLAPELENAVRALMESYYPGTILPLRITKILFPYL